jgi:hypothetical protein
MAKALFAHKEFFLNFNFWIKPFCYMTNMQFDDWRLEIHVIGVAYSIPA